MEVHKRSHRNCFGVQTVSETRSWPGFFELGLAGLPQAVEIVYFGLLPDFQGRGLARWEKMGSVRMFRLAV